jgi:TRAP-type C4-dicarboxylate transport system permease small subunit
LKGVLVREKGRHPLQYSKGLVVNTFEKVVNALCKYTNWVAAGGLLLMAAWIIADIVGIKIQRPMWGGIEMVGFLGVVVSAFSMGQTEILKGHIEIDFIDYYLPKKALKVIHSIVYIFGIALWAVIAWRSYDFALTLQTTGEVSMTERIPFYPFIYAMAFCSVILMLRLIVRFGKEFSGGQK